MKIIYIFHQILKKNKFTYIWLSVQLTISMIALIMSISVVIQLNILEKVSNSMNIKHTHYFIPNERFEAAADKDGLITKLFSKPELIRNFARIYDANSYIPDLKSYQKLYIYNSKLTENFNLPLSKGKWFSNENNLKENEYIELIISNKLAESYELGSILFFNIINNDLKQIAIKGKVIGILDKEDYYLAANGTQLSSIIKQNELVIIIKEPLNLIETNTFNEYGAFYISNEWERHNEDINKIGNLVSIDQIIKEYKDGAKEQSSAFFTIGLITFLITLGGIGGLNALQLHYLEHTFSIYYMLGAKWIDCVQAVFLKYLILMIVPTLTSLIVINILSNYILSNILIINVTVVGYSLILVFIILIVTSWAQLIKLYRKSPILFIRQGD